jgi:hypothetical protein
VEAADVALLLVYAFVVVYFLRRFVRYRKLPSLGIALLPTGWVLLALSSGISGDWLRTMKWLGVLLGVGLMASVTHADKLEKR